MKSSRLGPGRVSLERGSTFKPRTDSPAKPKRRPVSPASEEQRAKVRFAPCVHCAIEGCHPAHVIDRSLGGDNDPRAVVPLCPACHRAYDDGRISILEDLEPHFRVELAYAVHLVGLVAALNRVTNDHYVPTRSAA